MKGWLKLLSVGLTLSLALLSGCGAASNESTGSNSNKSSNESANENTNGEERIVATTVAITEIMDALEIDLVGIPSSYKELPQRYKDAREVGNPMSPDMELLLSLKPTEILSVTTLKYDLEKLFADRGIEMNYLNFESLASMLDEISRMGERYDRKEQAATIVQQFEDKRKDIEERTTGKEAPKVLILLGIPGSYLTATEHSYIGDLVKISGGQNIITGEKAEFLASNTEYLQQANPDVILRAAHGMPDEVVKMFDEEFQTNDIWKHFNAVKNGRVYDLEETLFGTTGNLAAAEALDILVDLLYPE